MCVCVCSTCTGFYVRLLKVCVHMFCVSVYNSSEQRGQESELLNAGMQVSKLKMWEGKVKELLFW